MTGWTGLAMAIAVLLVALFVAARRIGSRPLPTQLAPGKTLPSFSAVTESGIAVRSDDLRGTPAVILFVRGNWCPFCSRQVNELSDAYRRINELGARLILVTPKPLETTRRVAEFFDFDFEFWLDDALSAARQLGLVHTNGVPDSHHAEYGNDTVWPAAVVTDADGTIRDATISRLIADRPKPERFVRVLQRIQSSS